jgi:hypothetical protein
MKAASQAGLGSSATSQPIRPPSTNRHTKPRHGHTKARVCGSARGCAVVCGWRRRAWTHAHRAWVLRAPPSSPLVVSSSTTLLRSFSQPMHGGEKDEDRSRHLHHRRHRTMRKRQRSTQTSRTRMKKRKRRRTSQHEFHAAVSPSSCDDGHESS